MASDESEELADNTVTEEVVEETPEETVTEENTNTVEELKYPSHSNALKSFWGEY